MSQLTHTTMSIQEAGKQLKKFGLHKLQRKEPFKRTLEWYQRYGMTPENMVETPTLLIHDIVGHIALVPRPGLPPNAYFEQFADPIEMGLLTHVLPQNVEEKLEHDVLEHTISTVWNQKESVISVGRHHPYTPLPQRLFGNLLKYSRTKYEALLRQNPQMKKRLNLNRLEKDEIKTVISAFTEMNTKHKDYNSARSILLKKVVIPAFDGIRNVPSVKLTCFEKEAFPEGIPNAPEYQSWRKEAMKIEVDNPFGD